MRKLRGAFLLLIVGVIFCLGFMVLVGCGDSVPSICAERELQIRQDWAELHEIEMERAKILRYYGTFNNHSVVRMCNGPYFMAVWREVISGVEIRYNYGYFIEVWVDGQFLRLKETYDKQILTRNNIRTIARRQSNRTFQKI